MSNIFQKSLLFAVAGMFVVLAAGCVETQAPTDSNLPASGQPQKWETVMPGMSGMMPDDR